MVSREPVFPETGGFPAESVQFPVPTFELHALAHHASARRFSGRQGHGGQRHGHAAPAQS